MDDASQRVLVKGVRFISMEEYRKYEPIDGKWYFKEQLGEGSYGKVFRVERSDMSGTYSAALKIITIPKSSSEIDSLRQSMSDESSVTEYYRHAVQKMLSEFKLMSQLKANSNIVSYEDHNIIRHEDGIGYDILIRMELLNPLKTYLKNHPVTREMVIRIGIDICKALESCQQHNIVHRDIKPENIFVSDSGDFKLGDFGVARTMSSMESFMTKAGTSTYMAPELYKGDSSRTNVDIYSLGMVMYILMNNNRAPFLPPAPNPYSFEDRERALSYRLSGKPFPRPVNADPALASVIMKACDYDQGKRYQTPQEMKRDLEKLLYDNNIRVDAGRGHNKQTVQKVQKNHTAEQSEQKPAKNFASNFSMVVTLLKFVLVLAAAVLSLVAQLNDIGITMMDELTQFVRNVSDAEYNYVYNSDLAAGVCSAVFYSAAAGAVLIYFIKVLTGFKTSVPGLAAVSAAAASYILVPILHRSIDDGFSDYAKLCTAMLAALAVIELVSVAVEQGKKRRKIY